VANFTHDDAPDDVKDEAVAHSCHRWTEKQRSFEVAKLLYALEQARDAVLHFATAYCAAEVAGEELSAKERMVHGLGHKMIEDTTTIWTLMQAVSQVVADESVVISEDALGIAIEVEGKAGEVNVSVHQVGGTRPDVEGPGFVMSESPGSDALTDEQRERLQMWGRAAGGGTIH
jgi:hypothetical protein